MNFSSLENQLKTGQLKTQMLFCTCIIGDQPKLLFFVIFDLITCLFGPQVMVMRLQAQMLERRSACFTQCLGSL